MISRIVLSIDKKGSYLGKSGNRFIIRSNGEKKEYSADVLRQIIFEQPAAITTEAIKLAVEKNIDIIYLDWYGHPFARTYRPILGGTTLTRRKQLEAYFSDKGTFLVKKIVEAKIKSQLNYLKSISNNEINQYKTPNLTGIDGSVDEIRGFLLGIEGSVAAKYFKSIGKITGVSRRDPKLTDNFNVCLNYAYGILYAEVERACIIAGLDPYLGFYHTDRYGKPSMVLDLTEVFRVPVADRAIITLFNLKQMRDDYFITTGDKTLSKKGRKKIIQAVMKRLNARISFKNKKMTLQSIILEQAREIAAFLTDNKRSFKIFIYKP